MPAPTSFGELLRQHRLQIELTQEALAERAGLALRSVQALERGETHPRRDTAQRLARALALDARRRSELEALAQPLPRRRQPDTHLTTASTASPKSSAVSASPEDHPNNLPVQLTSFIGRERETHEIQSLLASHRLVTLTGTGGCGKTRLAYQVAADMLPEYPGGIWVAEFAPVTDPGLVAQTTATSLGLRDQGSRPIESVLVSYLRDKRLLLVLDNCEHLVSTCARLVDSLLRAAPDLRILTTSRELLGVAGESAYRVPSLAVPEPGKLQSLDYLGHYESVGLLVDRARLADSGFTLTERNASAVAQVCQRLDGIPLAIELAAARLASLSIEQVAARLTDRFRLLTGGSRTAIRRQQTLPATIDWSHDLLTSQEAVLFRRLAVFAGGWSLEAAEDVCAGPDVQPVEVLDLLGGLVAKSLVVADARAGEARYRLPETIRQYAGEKLWDSAETAITRERHRAFYSRLVESFEDKPWADPGVVDWIDRMQSEHDNLRSALQWCLETDADAGLRIAGGGRWGILQLWLRRGYFTEGRRWLADLLAAAPEHSPHRASALFKASLLAWYQGELDEAVSLAERCLEAEGEHENLPARIMALSLLGTAARDQGDFARAETQLTEAYRLAGDTEPDLGSWALQHLGVAVAMNGDLARARIVLDESLAIVRRTGNGYFIAGTLGNLGWVACCEGDYERSRELLEEGVAIYRRMRSDNNTGWLLGLLGYTASCAGDHRQADALLREGLAELRPSGQPPRIVGLLCWVGIVAHRLGFAGRAVRLISAATASRRPQEMPVKWVQRGVYEAVLADAKAALGEEAFERARAEGQAMTLDQAVENALAPEPDR